MTAPRPDPGPAPRSGASDPVRARRQQAGRLAAVGQRLGYGFLMAAVVAFAAGAATTFTPGLASVVVACLIGMTITLAPAIVLGYAVRAAERDDPRAPSGGGRDGQPPDR